MSFCAALFSASILLFTFCSHSSTSYFVILRLSKSRGVPNTLSRTW